MLGVGHQSNYSLTSRNLDSDRVSRTLSNASRSVRQKAGAREVRAKKPEREVDDEQQERQEAALPTNVPSSPVAIELQRRLQQEVERVRSHATKLKQQEDVLVNLRSSAKTAIDGHELEMSQAYQKIMTIRMKVEQMEAMERNVDEDLQTLLTSVSKLHSVVGDVKSQLAHNFQLSKLHELVDIEPDEVVIDPFKRRGSIIVVQKHVDMEDARLRALQAEFDKGEMETREYNVRKSDIEQRMDAMKGHLEQMQDCGVVDNVTAAMIPERAAKRAKANKGFRRRMSSIFRPGKGGDSEDSPRGSLSSTSVPNLGFKLAVAFPDPAIRPQDEGTASEMLRALNDEMLVAEIIDQAAQEGENIRELENIEFAQSREHPERVRTNSEIYLAASPRADRSACDAGPPFTSRGGVAALLTREEDIAATEDDGAATRGTYSGVAGMNFSALSEGLVEPPSRRVSLGMAMGDEIGNVFKSEDYKKTSPYLIRIQNLRRRQSATHAARRHNADNTVLYSGIPLQRQSSSPGQSPPHDGTGGATPSPRRKPRPYSARSTDEKSVALRRYEDVVLRTTRPTSARDPKFRFHNPSGVQRAVKSIPYFPGNAAPPMPS